MPSAASSGLRWILSPRIELWLYSNRAADTPELQLWYYYILMMCKWISNWIVASEMHICFIPWWFELVAVARMTRSHTSTVVSIARVCHMWVYLLSVVEIWFLHLLSRRFRRASILHIRLLYRWNLPRSPRNWTFSLFPFTIFRLVWLCLLMQPMKGKYESRHNFLWRSFPVRLPCALADKPGFTLLYQIRDRWKRCVPCR